MNLNIFKLCKNHLLGHYDVFSKNALLNLNASVFACKDMHLGGYEHWWVLPIVHLTKCTWVCAVVFNPTPKYSCTVFAVWSFPPGKTYCFLITSFARTWTCNVRGLNIFVLFLQTYNWYFNKKKNKKKGIKYLSLYSHIHVIKAIIKMKRKNNIFNRQSICNVFI